MLSPRRNNSSEKSNQTDLLLNALDEKSFVENLDNLLQSRSIDLERLKCIGDQARDKAMHNYSLACSKLMIQYFPSQWLGYVRAALDALTLGLIDEAKEMIEIALLKHSGQINVLIAASDIYRKANDLASAILCATSLIYHFPNNPLGSIRLVNDLIQSGDRARAGQTLGKALSRFPENPQILHIAVRFYCQNVEWNLALDFFKKLIHVAPGLARGNSRLIKYLLSTCSDWTAELDRLNAIQPQNNNSFLAGLNHYKKNRFKTAWLNSFQVVASNTSSTMGSRFSGFQPFQYWSQGSQPSDLKDLQTKWNQVFQDIDIPPIQLFDKNAAGQWIDQNVPELSNAFMSAFHYAVEADIFRIAYALKNDCIWLDSDLYPTDLTKPILSHSLANSDSCFYYREGLPWISNAFFATRSESPFFKKVVQDMANFTFSNLVPSKQLILQTFGPARFNRTLNYCLRQSRQSVQSTAAWRFAFVNEFNFCKMTPPWKLNYKGSSDSWQFACS